MYQILSTFRTWDIGNPYGYVILYDELTGEKMSVKSDMLYPYMYGGMLVECNIKELNETIEANTKNSKDLEFARATIESSAPDAYTEATRRNESEAEPRKLPNNNIITAPIV